MKEEGISGRDDFEKQMDQLGKMDFQMSKFRKQIQSHEIGFRLFKAVLQGIEQAGREMQQDRKKTKVTPFKKRKI